MQHLNENEVQSLYLQGMITHSEWRKEVERRRWATASNYQRRQMAKHIQRKAG